MTAAALLACLAAALPGQADTSQPYLLSAQNMKAQIVGRDKVTRLLGEVEIVHGSTVLKGDSAWVSTLHEKAVVWGRVVVTDRNVQMTGRQAVYYKKLGKAVMHGQPLVHDGQWRISADSLAYFRTMARSDAYGRVAISDSAGLQRATGDIGEYWHDKGYGWLSGNPKIEFREGRDTTTVRTITADRMEIYQQGRMAIATGDVRYAQDSLPARLPAEAHYGTQARSDTNGQGVVSPPANTDSQSRRAGTKAGLWASCGRATYYRDQGRLAMEQAPRIWQRDAELTARLVTIGFQGDTIRSLEARDSVQLEQFLPGRADTDRIRCDSLSAQFEDGRLAEARAQGNVWSLYHQVDRGSATGSNIIQSQTMAFHFRDGKIARVSIPAKAKGVYYSQEQP